MQEHARRDSARSLASSIVVFAMATPFKALRLRARFAFWPLIATLAFAFAFPFPSCAFTPVVLPLLTNSSWITDSSGARVKLACVSWAGHLEAGIPEGLSRNAVSSIAALIHSSGFNCVRLTSSTWLWTRNGSVTVTQQFQALSLTRALAGVQTFNPTLLHVPLRVVHESVVATLGAYGLLVILDNHVSKPQWCCGNTDGNGFWGDAYFDADEWVQGLVNVAVRFRSYPHVVGMSLRNELRGPNQNSADWVREVGRATAALHARNPKLLIIAGGVSYASDLSFVTSDEGEELAASAPEKFMHEFHWYKWFARQSDFDDPEDTEACKRNVEVDVRGRAHSQQKRKVPYLLSEFGVKQQGALGYGDGRFLECVIAYLKEEQESWALWALQGSYYVRQGVQDMEETFGVLDAEWHAIRNPELIDKLQPIQAISNSCEFH